MLIDPTAVPTLALADFGEPVDVRTADGAPATRTSALWDEEGVSTLGQGYAADTTAVLLPADALPGTPASGWWVTRDPDGAAPVTWEVVTKAPSGAGMVRAAGLWWLPLVRHLRTRPSGGL